jgi:hypothetical protein
MSNLCPTVTTGTTVIAENAAEFTATLLQLQLKLL